MAQSPSTPLHDPATPTPYPGQCVGLTPSAWFQVCLRHRPPRPRIPTASQSPRPRHWLGQCPQVSSAASTESWKPDWQPGLALTGSMQARLAAWSPSPQPLHPDTASAETLCFNCKLAGGMHASTSRGGRRPGTARRRRQSPSEPSESLTGNRRMATARHWDRHGAKDACHWQPQAAGRASWHSHRSRIPTAVALAMPCQCRINLNRVMETGCRAGRLSPSRHMGKPSSLVAVAAVQ